MAMTYQNFASLGVNLNRQKYGPLDISNVFTSEADLKYYLTKGSYKENVSDYWLSIVPYPYEGQVLATVIDGAVAVYVLALNENDEFITQEIAGKIVADETTITVAEDGSIGLANVPTENGTYNAIFTNGTLTWELVDNSAITEAIAENAQAIADESAAARSAEQALGARIDAIDLTPYAKSDDVTTEIGTAIDTAVKGILGEGVTEAYNTLKDIQDILEGTDGEKIDGIIESVADNKAEIAKEKKRAEDAEKALQEAIDAIDFVSDTELATELEAYAKNDNVYSKAEADKVIEEALSKATGGESAADVALALANYKKALNLEVYGNEAGTGDSRIDALEAVGAQANILEGVQVDGTDLAITNKKVNVNLAGRLEPITQSVEAVRELANNAGAAAQENARNIATINTTLGSHQESLAGHSTLLAQLADTDASYETRIKNAEDLITGHTKDIASKAASTRVEEIARSVASNENAIGVNAEAIAALGVKDSEILAEVNKKIDATTVTDNYYNKTSIDTTIAGIEEIITNKETAINSTINTKVAELAEADAKLDTRLSKVEDFFATVETSDGVINTLDEIVSYIESDKSGAAAMLASINANTDNIEALTQRITNNENSLSNTIETAIANAMVKADGTSIKNTNGTFSVAAVSTDLLTQGKLELVLNGGSAV